MQVLFHQIIKKIKNVKDYSLSAIYGWIELTIATTFYHSKTIKNLLVECAQKTTKYNFSIVAIVKNESIYIKEWIEYHLLLGINHFYLYDNESSDNLHEILRPYIDKGIVTYIYCPGKKMQMPAYNDAIARFKKNSHWMAFIDADEFIVLNPEYSNQIMKFMEPFENYDMLGINWSMFDFNDHETQPQSGFVISNYTRCFADDDHPINRHQKCIVKPSSAKICINPHHIHLKFGNKAVDENFQKLTPLLSPHVNIKKIRINHYFSKSKEEYLKKINRGKADALDKRPFNKSSYDFSQAGTKQSEVDLSSFIEILQNKIPDTYR